MKKIIGHPTHINKHGQVDSFKRMLAYFGGEF